VVMKIRYGWMLVATLLLATGAGAQGRSGTDESPEARAGSDEGPDLPEWVRRSNANAQVLLDTYARFNPEQAGSLGMTGLDKRIVDLGPARPERVQAAFKAAAKELEGLRAKEKDPRVREDLSILIRDAQQRADSAAIEQRYLLPVFGVAEHIFDGVKVLLDPQVAPERRADAAVRLRRYAGLEPGYIPLAQLAEARTREQLDTLGLLFPYRRELEQQLANSTVYLDGVSSLLKQYDVKDADKSVKELRLQVAAWDDFLRREVLPKARDDYRLPPELYALRLREVGVDAPTEALARQARIAYAETRNEMAALAPLVARQLKMESTDYREVLRELDRQQVTGEAILPLYEERLAAIEEIIQRERIVTLPDRPARIRLATAAESARVPAPQMIPPPFINNRGEQGEFVLPLAMPAGPDGTAPERYDDFTSRAVAWTLTAHEVRPGHELQFARMVEEGVSLARGIFAFNSANVEGWALYAEAETKPYLPLDGQLAALQFRLLRAARAFLDPALQKGDMTPAEAQRILAEEVGLSPAMARQEVERYTFRAPGQATSYFYGYQWLLDIRAQAEIALGTAFDRQRLHDFILAQGLLPPNLLEQAVRETFIPAERKRTDR
jgi:hypothetical protein